MHQREQEQYEENGAAMSLINLTYSDIWPSGFQRMRVKFPSKVMSVNVGSALIAYKNKFPEFGDSHLTAIFVSETANWFNLVNNYHADKTLSANNLFLVLQFKRKIINFAHLIIRSKFIKTLYPEDFPINYKLTKSAIKPIQSSVAILTVSLLMTATEIIDDGALKFYTSNTTQDYTESLFGELKNEGFGNPNPLRVLQLLKNRILTFRNMTNKKFHFFKLF